jgi:hypothetical protein
MCTLLVMAEVANPKHDWQVWFERAELAGRAHVSTGSVGRALTDLQAAGLIERMTGRDRCAKARTHSPRAVVWRLRVLTSGVSLDAHGARPGTPLNAHGARREHDTPLMVNTEPRPAGTQQAAEALTRDWWESRFPRPMMAGGFPAARKIVERALRAGWKVEEVAAALPRVQGTLVIWKLEEALEVVRAAAPARANDGFDNTTPEGGRRW